PFAFLRHEGRVDGPTPTDAAARGKDQQFESPPESVRRPDSKSIPPRRPSPPSFGRGSNLAARLPGKGGGQTLRQFRWRRYRWWNPHRGSGSPADRRSPG